MLQRFREDWVRPALYFGNNPISLAGGAITTASGVTMIAYWLVELFGRFNDNPYVGIIFFLLLPAVFVGGLLLIPLGVWLRRRKLKKAGLIPAAYPQIDLNDHVFRHGLDIVLVTTIVNLLVVAMASYRGAAYMDSPQFCGQSCHVMHPEYAAYKISAHSHVACAECHIGSGAGAYFSAKVNGTKQLIEVSFHPISGIAPKMIPDYPTPIESPVRNLRPARPWTATPRSLWRSAWCASNSVSIPAHCSCAPRTRRSATRAATGPSCSPIRRSSSARTARRASR